MLLNTIGKKCPQSFVTFCSRRSSHYDVLNVRKDCTQKDIKRAFIDLSKKHHPDMQSGDGSHDKFVKILEAYKTLSNPSSRASYDMGVPPPGVERHRPPTPGSPYNPYDSYYPYNRYRGDFHWDPTGRQSFYDEYQQRQRTGESIRQAKQAVLRTIGGFIAITFAIYIMTLWYIMDSNAHHFNNWNRNATQWHESKYRKIDNHEPQDIESVLKRSSKTV